jgi:hypothetical protein
MKNVKILSREIINDNFVGKHLSKNNPMFNKQDLCDAIDRWKYILKYQCNAKKGESILIGSQALDKEYLASIFAALELSMVLVIIDYSRTDDFYNTEYFDPKTKLLAPVDIFLHDFSADTIKSDTKLYSKFNFFVKNANRAYSTIDDINFDDVDISELEKLREIRPDPLDIAMKCTSSGTTGTPKIVQHTHEFLAEVSKRNAKFASGYCIHTRNLNHGSSLSVYLIPAMCSDDVTLNGYYDFNEHSRFDEAVKDLSVYRNEIHYIMFPYPFMVDEFIDASIRTDIRWPNLNIRTLSYVQQKPRDAIKNGYIKSIISMFGTNETSGCIFNNKITKDNLDRHSSMFNTLDDFYQFSLLDDGMIEVILPVYGKKVVTNDIFEKQGDCYIHKGRKDMVKVNGEVFDLKMIAELNSKYPDDAYMVVDSVNNSVYMAFWNGKNDNITEEFNSFLKNNFDRIQISKVSFLEKKKFISGIKLDNELLREYFRQHA